VSKELGDWSILDILEKALKKSAFDLSGYAQHFFIILCPQLSQEGIYITCSSGTISLRQHISPLRD
jgi:hypothetical protein